MTERRQAQRHQLKWNTEIRGVNTLGVPFIELCTSSDLSISGIQLPLKEPLIIGSKVSILIELPSYPKSFMRYTGEVARIMETGVGIKFDDTRPSYAPANTSPDSVPEILTLAGALTGGVMLVTELLRSWIMNRDSKVLKLREGDIAMEINSRMSAKEIEEKIKQLKTFAEQNLSTSGKVM